MFISGITAYVLSIYIKKKKKLYICFKNDSFPHLKKKKATQKKKGLYLTASIPGSSLNNCFHI